jgi:hypothetical protein
MSAPPSSKFRGRRFAAARQGTRQVLLLVAVLLGPTLPVRADDDDESNNGEDFTRPVSRWDLRYRYLENEAFHRQTLILRKDFTLHLNGDWQLATRIDVPVSWSDATTSGDTDFGLGNLLFQAAVIDPVTDRFAWGGGVRATLPTATEDQFGNGKYVLSPIAGARWKLPEISKGSFFQFVARYDSDLGGDADRSHISRLRMSPEVNIALPDRWFVTLFPSQDIAVNFLEGGKWFVPADFLIGRELTDRLVAGVEVSIPVIKEFALYDLKIEARLSFHF